MITYGFFNSVDGDRRYNADQMSEMFEGLITEGVFEYVGNAFEVNAVSDLTITVGTGRAFVDNKWIKSDAVESITLAARHATLSRYSAVVLRHDKDARTVSLQVIDGTPASTPSIPNVVRNSAYYDIMLAYILVPAEGDITITDTRDDPNRCGYVSNLVEKTQPQMRRIDGGVGYGRTNPATVEVTVPEEGMYVFVSFSTYRNNMNPNVSKSYVITGEPSGIDIVTQYLGYDLEAGDYGKFGVMQMIKSELASGYTLSFQAYDEYEVKSPYVWALFKIEDTFDDVESPFVLSTPVGAAGEECAGGAETLDDDGYYIIMGAGLYDGTNPYGSLSVGALSENGVAVNGKTLVFGNNDSVLNQRSPYGVLPVDIIGQIQAAVVRGRYAIASAVLDASTDTHGVWFVSKLTW